jgi:nitrite reductase/ring-hydroxylating ferredoxin subunit
MTTLRTRKDFLKMTGKASCALMLAGLTSSVLESCATAKVYHTKADNGKIKVALSEFTESNTRIVRVEGLQYDVMVVKKQDGAFNALLMRCSHQDFNLSAGKTGLYCGLHGSAFDLEGKVKTGPATEPLKKLNVEQQSDYIIIS